MVSQVCERPQKKHTGLTLLKIFPGNGPSASFACVSRLGPRPHSAQSDTHFMASTSICHQRTIHVFSPGGGVHLSTIFARGEARGTHPYPERRRHLFDNFLQLFPSAIFITRWAGANHNLFEVVGVHHERSGRRCSSLRGYARPRATQCGLSYRREARGASAQQRHHRRAVHHGERFWILCLFYSWMSKIYS